MTTWSLPRARPISCNDCPALQRPHMSICWLADSFTRLLNVINTTFREKIYSRWCCIDRLSWHDFSGLGHTQVGVSSAPMKFHVSKVLFMSIAAFSLSACIAGTSWLHLGRLNLLQRS